MAHKELAKKALFTDPAEAAIDLKRKKMVQSQSSRTSLEKAFGSKPTITEEDLTSAEGLNQYYWEVLAEKRRAVLEESLSENMDLYEQLSSLKEELSTSKQMLQESRNIVEVLTELLQEDEVEKELRLGSTAVELAWKMTAALCRKYRATATTSRWKPDEYDVTILCWNNEQDSSEEEHNYIRLNNCLYQCCSCSETFRRLLMIRKNTKAVYPIE
ncbi:conserved hypothetical protein [Culex quinquefasciatus]|uniref:Geminin n=1 Tax=Culex quinquefasciatus TaxID=7176 RepID=B0X0L2_CULQU|nr:conserved hypothetical protein [Culex quinquefasciatus]|eukprot:XP_001863184.1 conserved hypothetical protein [Culex quinquefasciatus]